MRNASIATCLLLAACIGLPAAAVASCASTPEIDVVLQDPLELREGATFAQLVIFDDGCPDKNRLAEGDVSGHRWMQSTSADGSFTEIGKLPKASYGFVALLRNDRCGVMGFGCTPVNLDHHRHVTIAVNELVDPPLGACEADETCSNSQCVPGSPSEGGTDASDAKPDTGPLTCELELVAAEGFDLPTESGMLYDGPAVVATPTGFVIAYYEADPAGAEPRVVRLKISDEGEQDNRANSNIPSCAENTDSSGLAAAWNDEFGAGLMTLSRPACDEAAGDQPTMRAENFDREGETIAEQNYPLPSNIQLTPVKALAPSSSGDQIGRAHV